MEEVEDRRQFILLVTDILPHLVIIMEDLEFLIIMELRLLMAKQMEVVLLIVAVTCI